MRIMWVVYSKYQAKKKHTSPCSPELGSAKEAHEPLQGGQIRQNGPRGANPLRILQEGQRQCEQAERQLSTGANSGKQAGANSSGWGQQHGTMMVDHIISIAGHDHARSLSLCHMWGICQHRPYRVRKYCLDLRIFFQHNNSGG